MKQILQAYVFPKGTITAIMILNKNTKAMTLPAIEVSAEKNAEELKRCQLYFSSQLVVSFRIQ